MGLSLLSTTDTQIIRVIEALYNQRPGNTYLSNYQTFVTENSIDGFANALAANFSSSTDAELAAIVTGNLGLTGDAVTAGNDYLEGQFAAYPTERGAVILAAMNALSTMESDATYGAAAALFNADVTASLTYSSVATNTAVVSSDAAADVAAGQTLTLTTAVDTLTGAGGDDTFTADNTGTSETTSAADQLDGGEGSDTINIFSDGAIAGVPQLTSIETANIYDEDADIDLSATAYSSLTSVSFTRGDGDLDITVGANVATVGFTDFEVHANDIVLALNKASTAVTLNTAVLTGGTGDDISLTGAALVTATVNATGATAFGELDLAGAKTVTLNATGKTTFVDSITTSATLGTLTITGAGAVDLSALDVGFTTVDASTATGGLTAELGTNDDTVLTGSTGNDTITADTTNVLATGDKLAVDAGDGTDTLVIAATADIDTAADGARYTNFETISSVDSVDMSLVAGVTNLTITGGTSESYTQMTATQLANVTFAADNTTSTIFSLAVATGTADAATINLASTTATTNIDVIGASLDNIETVNVNATTGTNATVSNFGFLANMSDAVTALNITGSADVEFNQVANTLDVVAVAIDASGLTGTGHFVLDDAGNVGLIAGSTVTGSANDDTIELSEISGTKSATYDGGAGNDNFTGELANLVATGSSDNVIDGGAGTADKITLADTTTTLTDNHFTFVSNMEQLALSNTTGDASITTGAGFNSAFANGATITTGTLAATKDLTLTAGLATVDITVTVDATSIVGVAADDTAITTGSGDDTITYTGGATYVGTSAAAGQGTIVISSGAGADTISVTIGTLAADTDTTSGQAITVTAGTGKDTITKVGVNADVALGVAHFVVATGDSTSTAYDEITGFDEATASTFSDKLDFTGTGAIGTLGTSIDTGSILSHSVGTGIATFDDAAAFATALTIDASTLADVVAYLAANSTINEVFAFAYDDNANGANDSTMVYHNYGTGTDSLVLLTDVTGADALITTNASAGTGDIFIG